MSEVLIELRAVHTYHEATVIIAVYPSLIDPCVGLIAPEDIQAQDWPEIPTRSRFEISRNGKLRIQTSIDLYSITSTQGFVTPEFSSSIYVIHK